MSLQEKPAARRNGELLQQTDMMHSDEQQEESTQQHEANQQPASPSVVSAEMAAVPTRVKSEEIRYANADTLYE